jgi:hypothetical protein
VSRCLLTLKVQAVQDANVTGKNQDNSYGFVYCRDYREGDAMMKTRFSFFVVFFLIFLTTRAGADIASVEAEIFAIDAQIQTLTNEQIPPLDAEIDELRQGMDEAREFMNVFAARNQWLLEEYQTHRRHLRQYQGREIQLSMSYSDFFEAKNTWEESSDPAVRREQIMVMFRYLYGNSRDPGQWELNPNTQQDFVDMADLIVRRNAVARIGQALVLLGDLTTELIGFISGIPENLKEAAFTTIEFTAKMTSKLLPSDTVDSLNDTCLQYIPFLELQKKRAEQLANDLNAIRDRDEFGGEGGRVEALAKTRALIEFEEEILAELEPEIDAFRARQAEVAASFARVQGELTEKIQERNGLRTTLRTLRQSKIDKEFQLRQLQEQQILNENGGEVNYVTHLAATASIQTVATDALTSALLHLPRYAVLFSNASYITRESGHQCSYSVQVGDDTLTRHESYHTKKTFSAPAPEPVWRKVNPTGDLNIDDNLAYGVAAGVVPLQAALSPEFKSENYVQQNCSSDYVPAGSGEKTSALVTIQVNQVNEALFLPDFYHYHERYVNNLSGTDLFTAIKGAAETYGPGIDLFVDGTLQQWRGASVYAAVQYADGTKGISIKNDPDVRPGGAQELFEINNRMKVSGKGEATLTPLVFDADGVLVPEGTLNTVHVTGNTVHAFVDAHESTGLTPADDILVVIDEPAGFAVSVDGPADMSHYEVKWRYSIYQETGWPKGWLEFDRHNGAAVTFFSSESGKWISANPVTLNTPADFNQQIKVAFDVCRKYDGVVVYSGVFDQVRTIVKGKKFFLAVKDTGEIYPGGNYFLFRGQNYLAPFITSRNLALHLDTGDGQSMPVPFTELIQGLLYGTDSADGQNLGTIKVYDEYIYTYLSTINASGRVELGLFEIQAADADSFLRDLGIVVERTGSTAMTGIDVNLFRVHYRGTNLGPMYVLKGCAPTSLDNFKTRWTFFDGTTQETPFVRIGAMQKSLTPMIKGLKQVEIVNPSGMPVATLGFLSASGQTSVNKVSREISRYYSVTSEYRYNPAEDRYAGQLIQIAKKELTGRSDQLTLEFQFPAGFPRVLVRTVNDMNNAALPVIENVMIDGQGLVFDAILPDSGFSTILSVLHAPASGSLNMDGTHVAYTPKTGFKGTDRFVIRVDCTACNITPDAVYHDLEVEIDASGGHPTVRFKQVFTPFYAYGGYTIGFALMDSAGQPLSTSLAREPDAADQLVVEVTEDGAAIRLNGFPENAQDGFGLGVAFPGGSSAVADINVGYYKFYPEFVAFRNRDHTIPPGLILHRFFEFFDNGARYIKDIWANTASGRLYLNDTFLGYQNQITADDLPNLVFRPGPDYTGPAAIYLYGSADGENWSSQMHIGGMVLPDDMDAYLTDPLWVLRLLSGKMVHPLEHSEIGYIRDESTIGMAEGMFLLQHAAGRRKAGK